jgi:hypothetical protein
MLAFWSVAQVGVVHGAAVLPFSSRDLTTHAVPPSLATGLTGCQVKAGRSRDYLLVQPLKIGELLAIALPSSLQDIALPLSPSIPFTFTLRNSPYPPPKNYHWKNFLYQFKTL